MKLADLKLGIYERALPISAAWPQKLEMAERLGFQFIELSIDESDERLGRLEWSARERCNFRRQMEDSGIAVSSMCLSGHRRFPLGSHDGAVRERARVMMKQAIELAVDTGIRTILLAGYDVYYEESTEQTREWFVEGLREALRLAARENVMLAVETMDTRLLSSITRFLNLKRCLEGLWFGVYPDLGNLSAWGYDVEQELELGREYIAAIHVKDALRVTDNFPGKFRDVPFGEGCVDFPRIFNALYRLDYTGPFLIEMWCGNEVNPEQKIAAARDWVIERMREGGYVD
ncbi:MAG: xylulose 5-phosphate 3-epimerase [Spirochaeta sp. LUC14_002_19_P3]|nr:MAG: xylulose 5-phosphate 3-epimerase [Spirochaeta sp. LUC14_002_19_P3]